MQNALFGKILKGIDFSIFGFKKGYLKIESEEERINTGLTQYPVLIPTNDLKDEIKGILYDLTDEDLKIADEYEGEGYCRMLTQTNIYVYVINENHV